MKRFHLVALCASAALLTSPAFAGLERFSVIIGGKNVGHLNVDSSPSAGGTRSIIDYDYKNNGRGPTMKETLDVDATGVPTGWEISGTTTFGSKVSESFRRSGKKASWADSTGKGSVNVKAPSVYVAQSASPWATGLYARLLMKQTDAKMAALPGGTLRLDRGEALTIDGQGGPVAVTAYDVGGVDTTPETVLIDGAGEMAAYVTPTFIVVRAGYEGEEKRLRDLAAKWSTGRYVAIQKKVAHNYGAPVRITNVRLFDPATAALTGPVTVLVNNGRIAAVEPVDSPSTPGEVRIDGGGGTLVAGMYEAHAHLGQEDAMLNLIAGITTVRDMGNDDAVLDELIERMDAGIIGGPRVIRSGFIEGKSPYSSNNGFVVDSEAKAIDAVRWYGARGFWQIKIYNSMNPAWVPAMVKEAHRLGMRVAGHVPAFSTADAMIEAGYDEMTHINQVMLGWVIKPGEDTRTLFRLTALKRLPGLDLNSAPVQHTIQAMVDGKKALDPTIGIHEMLTQNRDGQVAPGAVDYFDHLPIAAQRGARKAMIDTSAPGDDAAYRGAYEKILATLRMMKDRGIFLVPGTDTGGAFTYHREVELYTKIGFTPGEALKRATWDMARYFGEDQGSGSIEKGKRADFFLIPGDPTKDIKAIKRIAMVVKDGTFYF
ncbi:MAG: amidohydrolase, partial [Alphaproteobacteria bacterium]